MGEGVFRGINKVNQNKTWADWAKRKRDLNYRNLIRSICRLGSDYLTKQTKAVNKWPVEVKPKAHNIT